MGILNIVIRQRHYNGKYGVGSVFGSMEDYFLNDVAVEVCAKKHVYAGQDGRRGVFVDKSSLESFTLKEDDRRQLDRIVEKLRADKNYGYVEGRYNREAFDRRRFNFTDVRINDCWYEVQNTDAEVMGGLRRILRVDEILSRCGREEAAAPVRVKAQAETPKIEKPDTVELLSSPAKPELIEPAPQPIMLETADKCTVEETHASETAPKVEASRGFVRTPIANSDAVRWNEAAKKL